MKEDEEWLFTIEAEYTINKQKNTLLWGWRGEGWGWGVNMHRGMQDKSFKQTDFLRQFSRVSCPNFCSHSFSDKWDQWTSEQTLGWMRVACGREWITEISTCEVLNSRALHAWSWRVILELGESPFVCGGGVMTGGTASGQRMWGICEGGGGYVCVCVWS